MAGATKPTRRPAARLARASSPLAGTRNALLTPLVVNVFQRLEVGLTLWEDGQWFEIYEPSPARDPLGFELEHGVETERVAYNGNSLTQARSSQKTVVGRHSGFTDLFVPLCSGDEVNAVLVTGPFHTERPNPAEILERWRGLTGSHGHPSDPEFAFYLSTLLSILVLDDGRFAQFRELTEILARLCVDATAADEDFKAIKNLERKLSGARLAERMWEMARAVVDERTSRTWASPHRQSHLERLGVRRIPEHVAVGLFVNPEQAGDAVEEVIRRDAFQRACVELCRKADNVVSGQVGGYGISLLCASRGSPARTRRYLAELAEEAATMARRRFGLRLHLGLSTLPLSLPKQYQAALAAAESGLSKGLRTTLATSDVDTLPGDALGAMRRELAHLVEEKPAALPARFERYLEVVAVRSGQRLDPARVHLEAGFERIAEAFRESGSLEAKSFAALEATLESAAARAGSMSELFAAYRRAIGDVVESLTKPAAARRDRSLRRAEEYLRLHYREAVTLQHAARVAGFAPSYFSELFHKKQGVTFERYLMQLRIERAKQLLAGTTLNLQRVAQLSGFATRHYLGRVFKRVTRETPLGYRQRVQLSRGLVTLQKSTKA